MNDSIPSKVINIDISVSGDDYFMETQIFTTDLMDPDTARTIAERIYTNLTTQVGMSAA